jgi:uncharacterized OsmC-like protein
MSTATKSRASTCITPSPKASAAAAPADANLVNGIDVGALRGTLEAVKNDELVGRTHWSIRSVWKGGTRSDHHVAGCSIGGAFIPRPFVIKTDEPRELCGTNEYANPQEYLLAAMNACMMVGYAAVASLMGIRLTKLEVETTGDIDLRGFLGISSQVPAGYPKLNQTVRVAGEASREQFAKLHEAVRATSPNYFNITRAVPVESVMVVEGR